MPSSTSDPPTSPVAAAEDAASNNLQPFFILHKAALCKAEKKPSGSGRARRKIDLPSPSQKLAAKLKESRSGGDGDDSDARYEQLRLEAFDTTWSRIESTIKDVLKKINLDLFDSVNQWVVESFSDLKKVRAERICETQRPFPITTDVICMQIPTALLHTKNAEFVDDLLTFQELGVYLQSSGCYVANLSSLDFSAKHGVGSCLKSLLRQLVTEAVDVADITILSSWYSDPKNCDHPVIVIIEDMERCNSETLAEFITLLSEWVIKVPLFLIMGVATSIDAPRRLLPSYTLQHLQPFRFTLGSPSERMNSLIETVLVKTSFGFNISHKVAVFLRNFFLKHDGTVTSLVRALKIACSKHFSSEPLSFLGLGMVDDDYEKFWQETCETLPNSLSKHAFDLSSWQRDKVLNGTHDDLIEGLSKLRILQRKWRSVVLCLFEVGKINKMQLLDIFCEAADPSLHDLGTLDQRSQRHSLPHGSAVEGECSFVSGGFLSQATHNVRELSVATLSHLLGMWSIHTVEISEINEKVRELQKLIGSADANQMSKESPTDTYKRLRSMGAGKGTQSLNEKAAMLLDGMIRKYLMPIESMALHEIICFKNVDILQSALLGDPRRTIQIDLLKPQSHLQCSCCAKGGISPSMHDTSIMYSLAREYGDLINLHDWYQSFRALTMNTIKSKRKVQQSPASKKMKASPPESEAAIQARFCRAITELQISGLLRMPSKRRPDFVQRVAFGL